MKKRLIYLLQLMLVVAGMCACDKEALPIADDVKLADVYDLHANNNKALIDGIYNIYVYREQPKVTEVESALGANCKVYKMDNFVDESTDELFDFSFERVEPIRDEDGLIIDEIRLTYVVWGYKDREPYIIGGEDTPNDIRDDVYTRKELYLEIYNAEGRLIGSTPKAESNPSAFANSGLSIRQTQRTVAK